jgi:hypothetical protein
VSERARWDFKAILRALREQGWTVKPTATRHKKCVPPSPDREIVVIANSAMWCAQQNTIKDLRKNGFVWPWPPPKEKPERPRVAPERLDRLRREVKEAEDYIELVDEHLGELDREVEEVARACREALKERQAAIEALMVAKAALAQAAEGAT